jgi:glycosyltransferase involved in cell wall biosynthesis
MESNKNDDNEFYDLIYIGRLSPEKGIEIAILAIEKLVKVQGRQGIKLSIVGTGSENYRKELKELVNRKLGSYITFAGNFPSEDVPKLLHGFDIMLVPSIWSEPFGRVILEGMISHLAVIASNTGGPSEVIVNEENGLLFSPGDEDDLARKIESLIINPELLETLSNAGYETVLEKYTDNIMIDKIESYLWEVSGA